MADLDALYLDFLATERTAMVELLNLERDITRALAKEGSRLPDEFDSWVVKYNELSEALLGFVRTDRTAAVVRLRTKLKGHAHADPPHQEVEYARVSRVHRRSRIQD